MSTAVRRNWGECRNVIFHWQRVEGWGDDSSGGSDCSLRPAHLIWAIEEKRARLWVDRVQTPRRKSGTNGNSGVRSESGGR